MTNKESSLTPEMISAIKELIPEAIGITFEKLFKAYQMEDENLLEQDLMNEILEAGGYQLEEGSGFEDAVMIGTIVIAGPLGLA